MISSFLHINEDFAKRRFHFQNNLEALKQVELPLNIKSELKGM